MICPKLVYLCIHYIYAWLLYLYVWLLLLYQFTWFRNKKLSWRVVSQDGSSLCETRLWTFPMWLWWMTQWTLTSHSSMTTSALAPFHFVDVGRVSKKTWSFAPKRVSNQTKDQEETSIFFMIFESNYTLNTLIPGTLSKVGEKWKKGVEFDRLVKSADTVI